MQISRFKGFFTAPAIDQSVIAVTQHFRYFQSFKFHRPGVLRIFQQSRTERVFNGTGHFSKHARYKARYSVHNYQREGDAEHDDQRREQHLVAAARDLEENAQRDENQRGKQLIGRAEQRPDVGVADLREHIAQHKRQNRGEVGIAQKLAPWLGVRHIVHAEQLLKAHPRDTGNGVKAREGKGRDAHGHKDRGGVSSKSVMNRPLIIK